MSGPDEHEAPLARDDEERAMSSITWDMGQAAPMRRAHGTPSARRRPEATAPLRPTRRGRQTLAALALAVITGLGLSAQAAEAGQPAPAVPVAAHTVLPGETLWAIATTLTEPGQDVRETVDALLDLNGLAGSGLQAGQQLLLPGGG